MKRAPVLGSYVAEITPASRIDARTKIVLLIVFAVAVFLAQGSFAFLVWFVLLGFCMRAAHVEPGSIVRALRPSLVIFVLMLCANLVSCDGSAEIFLLGPIGLSLSGGLRGFWALLRIILLVGAMLVVSASTTSTELAAAFVRLLSPLGRLGVPVAEFGCTLSLALRFVPITAEEFQRIQLAQRVRGVDFDSGKLLDRIRMWASVFVPLIVGLFRRADRLAESMEARCYAGALQTPPKRLTRMDWCVLVMGLLLMTAVVLVSRMI